MSHMIIQSCPWSGRVPSSTSTIYQHPLALFHVRDCSQATSAYPFLGVETACSLCGEVLDCWSDDAFACCCKWCQGGPTHVSRRSYTSPDSEPVGGFVLSQGSVWTGWGPAIGSPGACVFVMFLGGWVERIMQEGVRKRISRPDHWGAAEWRGRLRTPDSSSLRVPGCLRLGKCLMSASVGGCGFS